MIVYKQILGHELEFHTNNGWKLERVLMTSRVEEKNLSSQTPPVANVTYSATDLFRRDAFVVKEPAYLVSKTAEALSHEAALRGEYTEVIEQLRQAAVNAATKSYNDDRDLKHLNKKCEDLQAQADERDGWNRKARKFEADLGKIREAIGTKAYDEILK